MPTLFVEAFGELSPDRNMPGNPHGEEDLYSVFRANAELMGWSTTGARRRPWLWGMNDAELTAGIDASRIGWVQVGLEVGVEAVMALPALLRCFHDALGRFGVVELSGLQVTGSELPSAGSSAADLISGLNWFNAAPKASSDALIVIDDASLEGLAEPELVAKLERLNTGRFEFGRQVTVSYQDSIGAPDRLTASPGNARRGVSVTLPGWTATAAAWALAIVIDASGADGPHVRSFTARVDVSMGHRP